MIKKVLFSLFIFLSLIAVVASTGCNVVANTTSYNPGTDPGRITTPEAIVSGSVTTSGGKVVLNINSLLVKGIPITGLSASSFKIKVGTGTGGIGSFTSTTILTAETSTTSKLDIVFVMDNTGSMSSRIISVKNSISAFAASIEASGGTVKFGVVSFGDTTGESSSLALPSTATQVSTWLSALTGVGGGDSPENPLEAIDYAYKNFTWTSGAQKIFIVITDNPCHQVGDGTTYTTLTVSSLEAKMYGAATVYAVSPQIDSGTGSPWSDFGTGDIRWLADGYGWFSGVDSTTYGVTRPRTGTGGRWIALPSSGDIDLTALGISTTVSKGYTISLDYSYSSGVLYIYVLVDTDGDGVFDSDGIISVGVTLSSTGKWLPNGELANPAEGVKPSRN